MAFYILEYSYSPNCAATNRLLAYYRALDRAGIETTVYYFMPDRYYSRIQEEFSYIHIKYLWANRFSNAKIFLYLLYVFNLKRVKRNFKRGDIIYTYNINALTKLALSNKKVKVFAERTEHPDASSGIVSKLVNISTKELSNVLLALDGLFVISEPLRDYYISQGVSTKNIHIINMTVDVSRFINIKKENIPNRYIAYCGAGSNNKDGVDELIKAFAIVNQKHSDIKLYIIGSSPSKTDQCGNMSLIENLGIKDKIIFTGVVSAEKIPQLLKNADILALDRPDSVQAKYGFPTKLGEYLLTGNPVVVTKVGDIPKFLKDGESALLAEERNPQNFAAKLNWVIEHPEEAKLIGRNGCEVALKEFNSINETNKIINIINLK